MKIQRRSAAHRPFFARTPRSFTSFLLVRLSQAFAVVVLAAAALLGYSGFAGPAAETQEIDPRAAVEGAVTEDPPAEAP